MSHPVCDRNSVLTCWLALALTAATSDSLSHSAWESGVVGIMPLLPVQAILGCLDGKMPDVSMEQMHF